MRQFESVWDVTPETAHPRARQLLTDSIYWDYGDDDSPLGNDRGADTFAAYLRFRDSHPTDPVQNFIRDHYEVLGITNGDWDILDESVLQKVLLGDKGFHVLMHDDFIVGLAFSQLVIDGEVDQDVQAKAVRALRRQATDVVLTFRGPGLNCEARRKQLVEFRRVLEQL